MRNNNWNDFFQDINKIIDTVGEAINEQVENVKRKNKAYNTEENPSLKMTDLFPRLVTDIAKIISPTQDSKIHVDVIQNNPRLLLKHLKEGEEDIDAQRSDDGLTALHLAAFQGKTELVELLLKYGADPNIMSYENSFTALHAATVCQNSKKAFEIAKLLLRYGARHDLKDDLDKKADEYAIKYKSEVFEKMLANPEQHKAMWDGYHKAVKGAELENIDLVELRQALNLNDFDKVYELIDQNNIDYHDVTDWAKYHMYEDKIGSISGHYECTHSS